MGYVLVGALLIGLALGMLGSGGSALTVPVLVYLVGHGAKESIAESMAIVGIISIVAALPYARAQQIDWRSVWLFGIPGMLGTFVGAWLGGIAPEAMQLVVFSGVLLLSAFLMLRKTSPAKYDNDSEHEGSHRSSAWKVASEGIAVGIVTGFVGVGGGFLIIPALVILGRLPMRLAIGTSLVIIAINAAVGFAKYEHYLLAHDLNVDWRTIALFATLGVVGSLIGRTINARLNQVVLKRVFAVFLIVLGGFVIVHEGSKLLHATSARAVARSDVSSQVTNHP